MNTLDKNAQLAKELSAATLKVATSHESTKWRQKRDEPRGTFLLVHKAIRDTAIMSSEVPAALERVLASWLAGAQR